MLANALDELYLLVRSQTRDRAFNYSSERDLVYRDEAVVVHVGEETHDELTVHAISDTAMARDRIAEVLDLECSLEAGSEEAAEWCNERGESREDENVHLHWSHVE